MWAAGHAEPANRFVLSQMINSSMPHNRNVTSHGISVSQSRYWAACNASKAPSWALTPGAYAGVQIKQQEFVPRPPLALQFCWEQKALSSQQQASAKSAHPQRAASRALPMTGPGTAGGGGGGGGSRRRRRGAGGGGGAGTHRVSSSVERSSS